MGQAKKQRECPAVGHGISAAECGENRQSRYACPESCAFNPFALAHYSALLDAEDLLDAQVLRRLLAEVPAAVGALQRAAQSASPHALHSATVWELFYATRADGRTFAAHWADAGWPGLRNDERVFMRGKMQLRVALLEVQCVREDGQFDAVDLLDPAGPRLRVVDRNAAARAGRFTTYLTWMYPLPHFWRMSGSGVGVPNYGSHAPQEIIHACIAHLGGPAESAAQRRWLAENFVRVDAAITATANERRRRMFSGLDAQWGARTYAWHGSAAAGRAALAAARDTDHDELSDAERGEGFTHARVWFEAEKKTKVKALALNVGGRQVLGRVLLAPDRVRIEAVGSARLEKLRRQFEAQLEGKVKFVKERRDDYGAQMAAAEPTADVALVPPPLLTDIEEFNLSTSRIPPPPPGVSMKDHQASLVDAHRRALIDQSLPALEGKTPREAAADPRLRPPLLAWMKRHVRELDEQNLRSGRRDDLNWMLRELGLGEIDFPPPPPRAIPADDENEAEEADDLFADDPRSDERDFGGDLGGAIAAIAPAGGGERPDPGPLPAEPLTFDEAVVRIKTALTAFAHAEDAFAALEREGATIIEEADELVGEWVTEDEFTFFLPFMVQLWFALVPRGVRLPLRRGIMAAAFEEERKRLEAADREGPRVLAALPDRCRQPNFLGAMIMELAQTSEQTPKKMRPTREGLSCMVLVLKTVIDEIDGTLRGRSDLP